MSQIHTHAIIMDAMAVSLKPKACTLQLVQMYRSLVSTSAAQPPFVEPGVLGVLRLCNDVYLIKIFAKYKVHLLTKGNSQLSFGSFTLVPFPCIFKVTKCIQICVTGHFCVTGVEYCRQVIA